MQIDTSTDFQSFDLCIHSSYYASGVSFSDMVLTLSTGCIEFDPCKQPVCALCICVKPVGPI